MRKSTFKDRASGHLASVVLLSLVLLASGGCAGMRGAGPGSASGGADGEPMTQARMELLFSDEVDAIVGPPGAIQTQIDGISIYLISQPTFDRMRIVAPIAMAQNLNRRVLEVLMEANFRSTMDGRYAISEGVIYAVFMHPISSLEPELLRSGLAQVVSLVKTFGTTFSSGDIVARDPSAPSEP